VWPPRDGFADHAAAWYKLLFCPEAGKLPSRPVGLGLTARAGRSSTPRELTIPETGTEGREVLPDTFVDKVSVARLPRRRL
jgi:hypothetical protein